MVNPGVYEVKSDAIIDDVIKLAGGFLDNAYQLNINLSKKIQNEMVIYIYTNKEINDKLGMVNTKENCKTNNYIIDECIDKKISIIEVPINQNNSVVKEQEKTVVNETVTDTTNYKEQITNEILLVNINTASKDELLKLNGIGNSKALAIIKYREEKGLFNNIAEIKNVSGIGEAAFAKIKDFITV